MRLMEKSVMAANCLAMVIGLAYLDNNPLNGIETYLLRPASLFLSKYVPPVTPFLEFVPFVLIVVGFFLWILTKVQLSGGNKS